MTRIKEIKLMSNILGANDCLADNNRKLWKQQGVLTLNMVSSPGAGKTTVLETIVERMSSRIKIGVIQGDLQTGLDAERIVRKGAASIQINTGKGCHLDANMIANALPGFGSQLFDLLVIENVGNLVCPTDYDLGEDLRMVVLSTAEGSDKPAKYPGTFKRADLLVVNKIDLLPYLDFNWHQAMETLKLLNPHLPIFPISAKTGEGMDALCVWLTERREKKRLNQELAQSV